MTKLEQAARQLLSVIENGMIDINAVTALKEALDHSGEANEMVEFFSKEMKNKISVARAQEQAEQEPVAYLCPSFVDNFAIGRYETCEQKDYGAFPVYAAPVRTKDLTEDEIIDELNKRKFDWVAVRSTTYIIDSAEIKEFARAIIAADREKNK